MTTTQETTHDFGDGRFETPAHRHPNGGGWVADTATVAPEVYVGGGAKVYGYAKVTGPTKLYDSAVVRDHAEVGGRDVAIMGSAVVCDRAVVQGEARMLDHTRASGDCVLSGNAQLHDQAHVTDLVHVTDVTIGSDATLHGRQRVRGRDNVIVFRSSVLGWTATITRTHMAVGCQFYTHKKWLKMCTQEWAEEEHGVTPEAYDRVWPVLKQLMRVAAAPKGRAKK